MSSFSLVYGEIMLFRSIFKRVQNTVFYCFMHFPGDQVVFVRAFPARRRRKEIYDSAA